VSGVLRRPPSFWPDCWKRSSRALRWRSRARRLRLIVAEHPANNHFYYYIGLLFLGSIPWMPMVAVTVWRAFAGIRRDGRQLFLWCWLLSNLVFFTIVQSKLPSYIFFLFVPLGLLVAWCLIAIVNVKAFGWRLPFHVFPLQLVQLLGVAMLAALLAALLPIVKLVRMQPAKLVKIFADER